MSIKRVGYKMPRSMAGISSTGDVEMGGLPIDPKTFLLIVIILIIIINLANIMLNYFLIQWLVQLSYQ